MFEDLVKELTKDGHASLEVQRDRSVRACRTQLIEAARRANVRIKMRRVAGPPEYVVATVLSPEDGERQQERDTIFRAVNRIRTGVDILTSGSISTEPIEAEVADLRDIIGELEDYAQGLMSGATD